MFKGIAVSVRPDKPDFLRTDAIAQLREDRKLITYPVYAPLFINDGTAPSRRNDLVDRHCVRRHVAASISHFASDPVQGRQHRTPHGVVRPELQCRKQAWQHTAIMIGP